MSLRFPAHSLATFICFCPRAALLKALCCAQGALQAPPLNCKPHSSHSELTPTSALCTPALTPAADLLLTHLKMQRQTGRRPPGAAMPQLPMSLPAAPCSPPAAGASPSWEHSSRPSLRAPKLLPLIPFARCPRSLQVVTEQSQHKPDLSRGLTCDLNPVFT